MGRLQITAVAICILMNALDGFDVLSISFAAPGIAAEWAIDRAALGLVLSMELIGMGVGSLILGNVADRFGRRPTILGCLMVMALGMSLAATSSSVVTLSIYRLVTGIGIGGMLAAINAMVAESSNAKNRNLAVTLMASGYPVGAIVGGTIASALLTSFDWRSVFVFGGIATAVFLPVVWFLLPESVSYLYQKRPPRALERINATLKRMGHAPVPDLPPPPKVSPRTGVAQLFSPQLLRTTLLLTFGYFAHIMTFYFILKWIPKLVVDMGFAASAAGGVLVWASVGGLAGSLSLSALTRRLNLRVLVIAALLLSAVTVAVFGQGQAGLVQLSVVAALAGFFTNAAIVGLYALFAQSFPTEVRAGGTGLVIGIGRGGAAMGPVVAGLMLAAGSGLPVVAATLACGSLVGAASIVFLRYRERASGVAS